MSESKKEQAKLKIKTKLMEAFHKNKGGTKADPNFTSEDANKLKTELQQSFDSRFPQVNKKTPPTKKIT